MIDSADDFIRAEVVSAARSYAGVPWRHSGRNKQGIDCVGLVVNVGKECGLHEYPDSFNYNRDSRGTMILEVIRQYAAQINPKDMLDGDIAVFRENVFPQHMGIVATENGQRTLIHAHAKERMVVEIDWGQEQTQKLMCAFRFNFLAGK